MSLGRVRCMSSSARRMTSMAAGVSRQSGHHMISMISSGALCPTDESSAVRA
jgi:hypothetical protein